MIISVVAKQATILLSCVLFHNFSTNGDRLGISVQGVLIPNADDDHGYCCSSSGRDRRMPGRPMFPPRMDRPRGPGPRPMPPQGERLVQSRLWPPNTRNVTSIRLTRGEPCQEFLAAEVIWICQQTNRKCGWGWMRNKYLYVEAGVNTTWAHHTGDVVSLSPTTKTTCVTLDICNLWCRACPNASFQLLQNLVFMNWSCFPFICKGVQLVIQIANAK